MCGRRAVLETHAASAYFGHAMERLKDLERTQLPQIQAAAKLCADSIRRGGLVFLFGSGHSRFLCEEMAPRQGCFVGFVPMTHTGLSTYADVVGPNGLRPMLFLERYEGYAERVLEGYYFGPHDAMIVISTSGIRPVVVEMAQNSKRRGLPVIAILSVEHCRNATPTHSSGQKLIDVADIAIDNHCPPGDCTLEIKGLDWRTGPLSTVSGAMIINMLRCETAELLLRSGYKPTMLPSHQFSNNHDAEEQAERYYTDYRRSLARLYSA
jgi:uncharacterized phosphosugar-binding protein